MNDLLLEFLRTGEFGPIRLGMSPTELQNQLGEPNGIAKKERIWMFGTGVVNIQIPFNDDGSYGIWLYLCGSDDIGSIPPLLEPVNWSINGRSSIEDVTKRLDDNGVAWRIDDHLTSEDNTCVRVQSNVRCYWPHKTELQKIMLTDEKSGRFTALQRTK